MEGYDYMEQDDYTVLHECPKCNTVWGDSSWGEGSIRLERKPIKEKGLLDIDGNKMEYERYPERLCPDCSERIIDGRRKGPVVRIDLEGKDLDYEDLKCQVCGSKDMLFEPHPMFMECGTLICKFCNSHNYMEVDNVYDQKIIRLSYREDLQTKEFNETIEEILEILKTEGIEIKNGGD